MTYTDEITENWVEIRIRLKQKYGILTDSDLVLRGGSYDEMLSRLEFILGHTKAELHKVITEFKPA